MKNSILLSLLLPDTDKKERDEEISEMYQLAATVGFKITDTIYQNKTKIDASTYFGKGKIKNIVEIIKTLNINTIFINEELNPSHFKNIAKITGEKIFVVDRTKLILDIFNLHAQTNEAKKQVKLATLEYLLPRLVGQWTHLERQMGGTGTRGGPGEKQIEVDRRLARKDITKLKRDLKNIQKQRNNQIKSRKDIFKIAIVGYTNAGKSSLLKSITGHNTLIKDQLFATLDTLTKTFKLPNNNTVLLSDTVGFLRKLPHNLIASFRSTLSEIVSADLIIKLIDMSSKDIEGHIYTIDETLKYLNCDTKDSLLVFNKIDKIEDIKILKKIDADYNNPLMISTVENINIDKLLKLLEDKSCASYKQYKINVPYSNSDLIKIIYNECIVVSRYDGYESITFIIRCKKQSYNKLKSTIK